MTTKSMVKGAWTEDRGQFLYHVDPDTRKYQGVFQKIKLKTIYSVPLSFTKFAWIIICWENIQFFNIYIYHHHHHHHISLVARISLALSRHSSLSFIALGRSSGLHPVSSHSCWMYVRAGRPAFARPCVGVHKSTSLMSSSLFLQQCPACLVRLTWIVFVIGGRWPYSWCLLGCCLRLHVALLCNCRLASSPAVLLASM